MVKTILMTVAALALVAPGSAAAARFAVGLEPGAAHGDVARDLRAATGGTVSSLAPFGLVLRAPNARGAASVPGVRYVERIRDDRRIAFVPTDPLAVKQWYLPQIRAFDAWTLQPPFDSRVRVAVIDSGIDATHPDLAPRIESGKSFVEGPWNKDAHGHGTFVAGIIAAEAGNGEGIAGIGLGADLLVAKVVRDDGTISLEVDDDGQGFDPSDRSISARRLGLVSMHERAADVGGSLVVESDVGRGTSVRAKVPAR